MVKIILFWVRIKKLAQLETKIKQEEKNSGNIVEKLGSSV